MSKSKLGASIALASALSGCAVSHNVHFENAEESKHHRELFPGTDYIGGVKYEGSNLFTYRNPTVFLSKEVENLEISTAYFPLQDM